MCVVFPQCFQCIILKRWEQRSGNEAMCVCVWMYARVNNYEVWLINITLEREKYEPPV